MKLQLSIPACLRRRAAVFTALLLTTAPVTTTWAGDYEARPDVIEFAQEMHQRHGFKQSDVLAILAQAEKKQKILDAISKPAETKLTWKEYRKIFMTDARISAGAEFWDAHASELKTISERYRVAPEIVVAIIGVETQYGKNAGTYRVLDALSTLAFDFPKRSAFFRQQLEEFLLLAREQKQDPTSLKGSYAGAMGYGQFMPSSYRNFAVDFDGDGFADIWNNTRDAAASVANYFQKNGWKYGEPVMVRASVAPDHNEALANNSLKPDQTLAALAAQGFSPIADGLASTRKATVIRQDGEYGPEYWLGFDNFYAITRYNNSSMYAMAVHQLAQAIKTRREAKT